MGIADKEKATVLGPDGEPVVQDATRLTADEAQLLRDYQAFGERHQLQGSMECTRCNSDMEVYVQDKIGFFCKCRVILWSPS